MKKALSILLTVLICLVCASCSAEETAENKSNISKTTSTAVSYSIDEIPEYSGSPYVVINNNIPDFSKSDLTTKSYEKYGSLDSLGRCTSCSACIGKDTMPTEKRGNIGTIKPSGWQTAKYNNIDGKYLYNRCHLIGYQLTAENANEKNLITGTRYLNVEGMLPFENEVADYVINTSNHVLYRVTPVFIDSELIARGVQMEAYSVEDNGEGVQFNVYCYNVQPDITIDYKTGKSFSSNEENTFDDGDEKQDYIVNISTKKFHRTSCASVKNMDENNKKKYHGTRNSLINNGYKPCGSCKP